MSKLSTLPPSATHWATATAGLTGLISSLLILRILQPFGIDEAAIVPSSLLIIGMTIAGIVLVDILYCKVHKRSSTGLDLTQTSPSWQRSLSKLIGLCGTLGIIAFFYWLLPEYRGSFYDRYYAMLRLILPWWLVLAVPYFYLVDRHMTHPRDGYWHVGQLFLLRWTKVDKKILTQHFLAWAVKGFFLPLMFTYLCKDIAFFLSYDFSRLQSFPVWFDFLQQQLYFLDVGLATMSYLMSLRIIDTHFRSSEPTVLGWVAALMCYQPFWSLLGSMYFAYEIAPLWGNWLWSHSIIYGFWGSCILILIIIYVWATIIFGARFSNLTHRGIITNGPYRFTKHPAYVAKNISYWMISIPFIVNDSIDVALRHSLLLLGVNCIYILRAKTEEWHLAQDPTYIAYATWIDQHGLLRWLNHLPLVNALRFKQPTRQS